MFLCSLQQADVFYVVRSGKHAESFTYDEVVQHVNMATENLPVTDAKLKQIAVETEKDRCLQQVITHRGECAHVL